MPHTPSTPRITKEIIRRPNLPATQWPTAKTRFTARNTTSNKRRSKSKAHPNSNSVKNSQSSKSTNTTNKPKLRVTSSNPGTTCIQTRSRKGVPPSNQPLRLGTAMDNLFPNPMLLASKTGIRSLAKPPTKLRRTTLFHRQTCRNFCWKKGLTVPFTLLKTSTTTKSTSTISIPTSNSKPLNRPRKATPRNKICSKKWLSKMKLKIWECRRWAPNQPSSHSTSPIYTRNFLIIRETRRTPQHPSATPTTRTWHLEALRRSKLKSLSTGQSWSIKEIRWANPLNSSSRTAYPTSTIERQMAPTCKMRAVAMTSSNRMQTASAPKSLSTKIPCHLRAKDYMAHLLVTWMLQANSSELWTSNRSSFKRSITNWKTLRKASPTKLYKIYRTLVVKCNNRLKMSMNMRFQATSKPIIIERTI